MGFLPFEKKMGKKLFMEEPKKDEKTMIFTPDFPKFSSSFPNHQTYQTTTKWMVIFLIGLILAFRRVARFFNINIFNFKKKIKLIF